MPGRALAASVTPLTERGDDLDVAAFAPLVRFLADGGVDGLLAMGTTGEGVLLSPAERERAAELFLRARPDGFQVYVHCGAQSTAETVRLARHAAGCAADGVAVIAPPYFALDERSMLEHFAAAAAACSPVPFYVYEFAARSGYAVPPVVIERLRQVAPNLKGMKVSDAPLDAVRPYLLEGLEVLVGFEPLVLEAMALGAAGAVSGLASAFPELVSSLVHERTPGAAHEVAGLRADLAGVPFHAAIKAVLRARGLPVSEGVRAPLRALQPDERVRVEGALARTARRA